MLAWTRFESAEYCFSMSGSLAVTPSFIGTCSMFTCPFGEVKLVKDIFVITRIISVFVLTLFLSIKVTELALRAK